MLTIYRRHRKNCPHKDEGRAYRRCGCPIWADGTLNAEEIRESLKLRNWEKAQEKIREWEAEGARPEVERITIEEACEDFLTDATARKLTEATLYKYRLLFGRLKAFAHDNGLRFLTEFDLPLLRKFRASWADGNISAAKKLERAKAFFRFAHETGWIAENPARLLKSPKVSCPPTMPFTRDEMVKILAACNKYSDNYGRTEQANAVRLRAFILLLRYSGMRIGDAVSLSRDRISGSRLFLYTQKTGVPVFCPLPDFVVEALNKAPGSNSAYFFWSGESKLKSAVGNWQRSLGKLFTLAGIPGGHAHRFRDTFAVELLLAGAPLERVSVLLGHRSVKVTEKHYAPWVRARQEQLEQDVRRTWSEDPIAFRETKGTPEVHGKGEAANSLKIQ